MFRAGLLLIIRRINSINSDWRYVDWLLAVRLYHLLFIQSWSSWWWAASLLETCRGLLLK